MLLGCLEEGALLKLLRMYSPASQPSTPGPLPSRPLPSSREGIKVYVNCQSKFKQRQLQLIGQTSWISFSEERPHMYDSSRERMGSETKVP
jgi:hypothetical protein